MEQQLIKGIKSWTFVGNMAIIFELEEKAAVVKLHPEVEWASAFNCLIISAGNEVIGTAEFKDSITADRCLEEIKSKAFKGVVDRNPENKDAYTLESAVSMVQQGYTMFVHEPEIGMKSYLIVTKNTRGDTVVGIDCTPEVGETLNPIGLAEMLFDRIWLIEE